MLNTTFSTAPVNAVGHSRQPFKPKTAPQVNSGSAVNTLNTGNAAAACQ
ncbi:hypothetical protein [Methylomonas koyamae]|nr:hypothetical protein [Methylomonas koyamae]